MGIGDDTGSPLPIVEKISDLQKVNKSIGRAFVGTPELSVPFMESLVSSGSEIGVVVTGQDRRRGRRENLHLLQ